MQTMYYIGLDGAAYPAIQTAQQTLTDDPDRGRQNDTALQFRLGPLGVLPVTLSNGVLRHPNPNPSRSSTLRDPKSADTSAGRTGTGSSVCG